MAVFNRGDMYAAIGTMMFSAGSNLAPGGELIMDKRYPIQIPWGL